MDYQSIIKEVIDYTVNYIEKPHSAFGNVPICPFSKKFRTADLINWLVFPFLLCEPFDPMVLLVIDHFAKQNHYAAYFVIHPNKNLDLDSFLNFCDCLQKHIRPQGLFLFRGHPQDPFKIGDIYTRREPYPNFQLLRESLILETRQQLKPSYFSNWSEEALREDSSLGLENKKPSNNSKEG